MEKENMFDLAMFMLRVVLGSIFVVHGAQKLFGMFGGIGLEGTAEMVEGLAPINADLLALIWAFIEFIGGIFIVLGIMARWAVSAIMLTVLISLCKFDLVYGFFIKNSGIEHKLLILGACIPLSLLGGGRWSVWDV